jgi:glycosyltransferase involved in cell wall biosynthesis
VGTISPIKRPEVFLSLATRFPARRFVMVGGPAGMPSVGSDQAAVEFFENIKSQALQLSNVEFVGYVPFSRVGRRFDGAAALVNTSEFEGLPNVFLQAWIRGIPTLSFVAPTTADEPTGTTECRDPDDMCRRLATLLEDPAHWSEASARVRRHFARCHSAAAVMPKYEDIFSALLTAPEPPKG